MKAKRPPPLSLISPTMTQQAELIEELHYMCVENDYLKEMRKGTLEQCADGAFLRH